MTLSRPFNYDEQLILRRSLAKGRRALLIRLAICEAIVLVAATMIVRIDGWTWQTLLFITILPVFYFVMRTVIARRVRRTLRDPRNRLTLKRSVSFNEANLTWQDSEGARSELPRSSV
ncbi:hypothetical protein EON79_16325, partial [bacterium]